VKAQLGLLVIRFLEYISRASQPGVRKRGVTASQQP